MKRETFGSRLGFILVSAGCAVGIGNVWKFPYMCGQFGGAAFILIYLVFLLIMGIPVMVCEFGVGRASRHSVAAAFETLEPKGTKWHITKWIGVIGCYFLMMFYTTVGGWMLYYCVRSFRGDFVGADMETVSAGFSDMLGNMPLMTFWTILICIIGFGVCAFGIQKGIEKVSKFMMTALLLIMIVLAIHSVMLKGAGAGIRFYLIPDFKQMAEIGIGNVIFGAMSQAFFTLSLGIGAMLIFGSYLNGGKSLLGEAINIAVLDTFVAITAGLIIFPACFSYHVQPDSGPKLIFMTLPHIFTSMKGGRIFGSFFFLFLFFAALSTIIAVFENIMCCFSEIFGVSRKQSAVINCILIILGSLPCALGYNVWSGFQPLGAGSTVLDLEDFIVSNLLLPVGSLIYLLFCTSKWGWGFKNYQAEASKGDGLKVPDWMRLYLTYILPLLLLVLIVQGLIG